MVFAPVLIPTLNRYQHFRQCIESLSNCTWAEYTEVFVALDYPASPEHFEGWEKNKEYLENCGNLNFKRLHVIYREQNYGIWRPGDKGNLRCLETDIRDKYDRYIVTEDDNVFSPCFLEYMDKGLELFENDERVLCLCGYKWYFPIKDSGNTFFRSGVSCTPWGMGYWSKKQNAIPDLSYKWFRKNLTIKNLRKVYKDNGPAFVNLFIELSNSNISHSIIIDQHISLYMTIANMHQIIPTISLVKNIGLDGSGVDMSKISDEELLLYEKSPISTDANFNFVGNGYEFYDYNKSLYIKGRNWKSKLFYLRKLINKIIRLVVYW